MRVVVIVAHPDPESFTHAIASRITMALADCGHQVVAHDLYAQGFAAAMSLDEREAYHSDTPVVDPLIAEHVADISAADVLVFVYPTWWSGLPAILKGWFERVMVPGVGFTFDDKGKVKAGLTNVTRLVGVSTYGSKWAYVKLVNDNGRRVIMRALRVSTALRTRRTWLGLYGIDGTTADDRTKFLDRCERLARSL